MHLLTVKERVRIIDEMEMNKNASQSEKNIASMDARKRKPTIIFIGFDHDPFIKKIKNFFQMFKKHNLFHDF